MREREEDDLGDGEKRRRKRNLLLSKLRVSFTQPTCSTSLRMAPLKSYSSGAAAATFTLLE